MVISKNPVSLILMVTLGCNSKCGHCCFACEPEKLHLHIPESDMMRYIEDAHKEGLYSVIFSGGEPMLYYESLIEPIKLAKRLGMYVDIRTNGYWASDYKETCNILRYLRHIGLDRIGLSYDRFHAEAMPQANITNVIMASNEVGVSVYLDWIGKESWGEVVGLLNIDTPTLRCVSKPLYAGRATQLDNSYFYSIPIEELESDYRYSEHCGEKGIPLLTVFPDGYASYHPCCWVNPCLIRKIQGNGWIAQLKEDMANSLMVSSFGKSGLGGLIKAGREICPDRLKDNYGHQCEACYDLLGVVYKNEVEELPLFMQEFKGVKV